jgi:hypothetical protein
VDDFGIFLSADLPFVKDFPSQAHVLVEGDVPVPPVNDDGHIFLDDEPFLEISLTAIQMGLFAGIQALLFKLLPYLATRDTAGESLHHLDYAQVDFTGLASAGHSDQCDAATIPNSSRIVSLVRSVQGLLCAGWPRTGTPSWDSDFYRGSWLPPLRLRPGQALAQKTRKNGAPSSRDGMSAKI